MLFPHDDNEESGREHNPSKADNGNSGPDTRQPRTETQYPPAPPQEPTPTGSSSRRKLPGARTIPDSVTRHHYFATQQIFARRSQLFQ